MPPTGGTPAIRTGKMPVIRTGETPVIPTGKMPVIRAGGTPAIPESEMGDHNRGLHTALFGLVLQLVLSGLTLATWSLARTAAAWPAFWLSLMPLPLWLAAMLLFYARSQRDRERQELEELSRRPGAESIFADGQGHAAADRLRRLERYFVPAFTLGLAAAHAAAGVLLLHWATASALTPSNKPVMILLAALGAFVAFVTSRYVTGLARLPEHRLLRAPGSYLSLVAMVLGVLGASLAADHYGLGGVSRVVAYFLPGLMLALSAELALNFVLDLYRPRVPDAEHRHSYESRLLDLLANPGSIGHSIAEALNYQFGFEVSSTWFYKLLQRALAPLLLTGAAVLWLMSGVVVVQEDEQAVVLHLGRRDAGRLLTPRAMPYLTWPWPVDTVRRFKTGPAHEIEIGVGAERRDTTPTGKRMYIWAEEHGARAELDTLVAVPPRPGQGGQDIPSVNVIKLVASVYYRITDCWKFGYAVSDAPRLLESIAYREMVQYAASAPLEQSAGGDRRTGGILGAGRGQTEADLKQRISQAAGKLDLGVEIVRVQLMGSHPPREAAEAFEGVIAAERERDRLRYEAQAQANAMLAEAAGDPDEALRLAQAIELLRDWEQLKDLQARAGDLSAGAAGLLERARTQLERLAGDIEQERLLGVLGPDRLTASQRLLATAQAHLEQLAQVRKGPAAFTPAKLDELVRGRSAEVERRLTLARGKAAVIIAQARAYRWGAEFSERNRAETFNVQMLAMRQVPNLYRLDRYLSMLGESLKDQKKYILALDPNQVELWLNLESPQSVVDLPLGQN